LSEFQDELTFEKVTAFLVFGSLKIEPISATSLNARKMKIGRE